MRIQEVKKRLENLADNIDNYLGELERNNKDKGRKYEWLLYVSGCLRELLDIED